MLPCIDSMRPVLRRSASNRPRIGSMLDSAAPAAADRGGHPVKPDLGRVLVLGIVDQEREREQGAVGGANDPGQGVHLAEGAGLRSDNAPARQACVVEE